MPKTKTDGKTQKRTKSGRFAKKPGRKAKSTNQTALARIQKYQEDAVGRKSRVQERPTYTSVTDLQRSYFTSFAGILRQSDMAVRRDRDLSRQMRRDPDVMSPLNQRKAAVALMEWELVPEDPKDEIQVEQAKELELLLRNNISKPVDFFGALLDAVWYGPAVVQIVPQWDGENYIPGEWMPIHSDTLAFTEDGDLTMYVGLRYEGEKIQGPYGFVHKLDPEEREQMILHTHGRQGPDYEVPQEADFAYRGRGLRDVLWFQWFLKQSMLQLWATRMERFGLGTRIGTYPSGNTQAMTDMQTVMDNADGDVSILIPREEGADKDAFSYSVQEVSGTRDKSFADLIEGYLAGQIKETIIGQTATTESTSSGLGSGVSDEHAKTFNRIITGDALNLGDTLSVDFVNKYHMYNFGDTPYRPRWEFAVEKTDPKAMLEAAKEFVSLGGTVAEDPLRQVLGFVKPEEGESTLSLDTITARFGGEQSFLTGLDDTPNAGSASERFKKFSKELRESRYGKK